MKIQIAFFLFALSATAAEPMKVLQLQGSATETVGKKTTALKQGSLLRDGGLIRVANDSMVIVSLGKDVVTKLAAGSEASFKVAKKKDWELDLKFGVTASAIRNPEKRPNHFFIRTRTAVMGVRGTVFFVDHQKDKPLFVCTCKGKVAMETPKGKVVDEITATHHDRPITLESTGGDSEKITVKTAPMGTGHSDADVEFLEQALSKL